jgi:hypothetical protein
VCWCYFGAWSRLSATTCNYERGSFSLTLAVAIRGKDVDRKRLRRLGDDRKSDPVARAISMRVDPALIDSYCRHLNPVLAIELLHDQPLERHVVVGRGLIGGAGQ